MNELQIENIMRGAVARSGQLLEVIATSMIFNSLAVIMGLFSVYMVSAIRTPQAYMFAPYVVAGSVVMAAKGGFMLHRKWDEYAAAEKASQQNGGWINPSVNVSKDSRKSVLIANILAVAAIALPVLMHSYLQIFASAPTIRYAAFQILPSLMIVIFSLWAWLAASTLK